MACAHTVPVLAALGVFHLVHASAAEGMCPSNQIVRTLVRSKRCGSTTLMLMHDVDYYDTMATVTVPPEGGAYGSSQGSSCRFHAQAACYP